MGKVMKKVLAVLITTLAVAGCVSKSINDVRQTGEHVTLESARSVDEVSQCILYKWQNKKDILGGVFGASIQPLPGGNTIYVDGNIFIADVTKKTESTTQVQLHLINLRNGWVDLTKTCL